MQDNYSFLVSVYEKVLSSLKEGVALSEIYSIAYNAIESSRPELIPHFTRTIGWVWSRELKRGILLHCSFIISFATGLEFREPSLQLSTKCSAVARKGCHMIVT